MIVHAALNDGIDLDGCKPGLTCVFDSVQHVLDATEAAAHRGKDRGVQRIQAHRDAFEAGGFELCGVFGQQNSIGSQRDIVDVGNGGQVADEVCQVGAQQRLAARQTQLADPQLHEQPTQAHDLIERQPLVRAQKPVLVVKGFARHAIRAAEVAPVHD